MKNNEWYGAAIIVAIAVVLLGAGYYAWFAPEEESLTESRTFGAANQEKTMPSSDEKITLSGNVNNNSQLVGDNGEAFELANTDKGLEVKSLIGKKVEVTGTVMEEAGKQVIEVREYNVLE